MLFLPCISSNCNSHVISHPAAPTNGTQRTYRPPTRTWFPSSTPVSPTPLPPSLSSSSSTPWTSSPTTTSAETSSGCDRVTNCRPMSVWSCPRYPGSVCECSRPSCPRTVSSRSTRSVSRTVRQPSTACWRNTRARTYGHVCLMATLLDCMS